MASFESIFPTFLQVCSQLHDLLQIVAFMLFIVGTVMIVIHDFTEKTIGLHMIQVFALTALLVFLPQWGNAMQSVVQSSIISGLGVDPSNVQDQYNQLLVVKHDTGNTQSWWDIDGGTKVQTPSPADDTTSLSFSLSSDRNPEPWTNSSNRLIPLQRQSPIMPQPDKQRPPAPKVQPRTYDQDEPGTSDPAPDDSDFSDDSSFSAGSRGEGPAIIP